MIIIKKNILPNNYRARNRNDQYSILQYSILGRNVGYFIDKEMEIKQ
jgi:hypothetical protein